MQMRQWKSNLLRNYMDKRKQIMYLRETANCVV